MLIVVGSANSSNSVRLLEVGLQHGAKSGYRVDLAAELDPAWFEGAATVGVTSGASVPEILVRDVLIRLAELGFDDVDQRQRARHQQHGDDREADRDLVGDHLRRRPEPAHQ